MKKKADHNKELKKIHETFLKTFGMYVQLIREHKKWSLEKLTKEAGLDSVQELKDIENGLTDIAIRKVDDINKALGNPFTFHLEPLNKNKLVN